VCSNFLTMAYPIGGAYRFKCLSLDKAVKTAYFRLRANHAGLKAAVSMRVEERDLHHGLLQPDLIRCNPRKSSIPSI
jgi:hypothetical protein